MKLKDVCPKCGRNLTVYYSPTCFPCNPPKASLEPVVCLFSTMHYLEDMGEFTQADKDRLWDWFCSTENFGNDRYVAISDDETYEDDVDGERVVGVGLRHSRSAQMD